VLAAIGAKGVKEVSYHREYAAQWVVRLGDGTALSHERMQAAVDAVWPLVYELFRPHAIELRLVEAGVAADPAGTRDEFDAVWRQVLAAATLRSPTVGDRSWKNFAPGGAKTVQDLDDPGGRRGVHTPALAEILAELQGLARSVPRGVW
jgi:ring-1,2-phenylacetyl-CoA epoxidase subunit PaaC